MVVILIPRYSCLKIENIWSDQSRFKLWYELEIAVLRAQMDLELIPKVVVSDLPSDFIFDVDRILQIESITKHDVIAFLTYVSEVTGVDESYLHYGMTSSDLLDTCYSIQLSQSTDIIIEKIGLLMSEIARIADITRDLVSIGRSHGIQAEPIVFGTKFLRFYSELSRSLDRLKSAKVEIAICKISGAMGNYANIDPRVQKIVAEQFDLVGESVASQVIPRDRHAFLFLALGLLASSIENIATEIRSLQRTEISEVHEGFSIGQKGSSAMPHKRNPILTENLTGLSRMIRSFVIPAMENVSLWHERDISHSSVERCFSPDAFHLSSFALSRCINVMSNLVIDRVSIGNNLFRSKGLVFSQRVLLELVNSGLSRDRAYELVQRNASKVWSSENITFFDALSSDEDITSRLSIFVLESLFDLSYYLESSKILYIEVLG